MKLFIKYMVSARCTMVLKEELRKLGLHFIITDMGEVEIMENITDTQRDQLKAALLISGLELMDDKRALIVEKIKNLIFEMTDNFGELPKAKLSDYFSEKLNTSYYSLAKIFSEVQGTTIEKFIIAYKIEKVKELIIYDELSLSEISWKLNFSSLAHLSNQFKKHTGLTPSYFKKLKSKREKSVLELP
jgi:AraC-like DNA-binding protein